MTGLLAGCIRRWRRWQRLSRCERQAFLELLSLQYRACLYLRLLGLARTRARMLALHEPRRTPLPHEHTSGDGPAQAACRMSAMTRGLGVFAVGCLPRSLALQAMLARCGVASQLRIGVLAHSVPLQAHAWVEVDGEVAEDEPIGAFQVFDTLGRPGA